MRQTMPEPRPEDIELVDKEADFRFGLRKRLYNWNMRIARELKGWRQQDLAEAIGVSSASISQIETLRVFPGSERAKIIAEALGRNSTELFPEWLSDFRLKRVPASTEEESISLEEAISQHLIAPNDPLLIDQGFEDEIERRVDSEILRDRIDTVLETLSPREKRIIELRFGLKDGRSCTNEEVGREFNVTRANIHQIEAKALRKLRHPKNLRLLKDFVW